MQVHFNVILGSECSEDHYRAGYKRSLKLGGSGASDFVQPIHKQPGKVVFVPGLVKLRTY